MKTKLFFPLWITLFLLSCNRLLSKDGQIIAPTPDRNSLQSEPLPEPILFVLPRPGSIEAIESFTLEPSFALHGDPGICVSFEPYTLMEPGDFLTQEELYSRIALEVDGILRDETGGIITDAGPNPGPLDPETGKSLFEVPGGSPYILCFAADLNVGQHTAEFGYRKTSGEKFQYRWTFYLFDFPGLDLTTLEIPLYLGELRPRPGTAQFLAEYRDAEDFFGVVIKEPSVCIQILGYELSVALAPNTGISLSEEELLSWLILEIDGKRVTKVRSFAPALSGYYNFCFEANLEAGVHTAYLTINKTPDERSSYRWQFMILE